MLKARGQMLSSMACVRGLEGRSGAEKKKKTPHMGSAARCVGVRVFMWSVCLQTALVNRATGCL